jgi:hypothetical protein
MVFAVTSAVVCLESDSGAVESAVDKVEYTVDN